jgi:hypothetical protein
MNKITYHRDGTITYWSVYHQVWRREYADRISDRELAAMNDRQRERIARHAAKHA